MNYQTINYTVKENVACITLNRLDAANGINIAMGRELMHAAICCEENPEVRAVVLTGAGKIFSVGGDIKAFAASDRLSEYLKELIVYIHSAVARFLSMGKPLITAVNGVAAGAGMSLAISGDLVIAAESATFLAAYAAAGLSPDCGMTYVLPRMIGMAKAKELILTNRRLSAQEALQLGIVNKIVPAKDLMREVESSAISLAKGPTGSIGMVKKLLHTSFSETLETQLDLEAWGIVALSKTKDGKEGMRAFIEKRNPHFIGSEVGFQ